ncbi:MAG: hypothetical protein ACKVX7_05840 [Planctomycetota bacterium]
MCSARSRRTKKLAGELLALAFFVTFGCRSVTPEPHSPDDKLARIGLEVLTAEAAMLPASDAARFIPCRVIPGALQPALPPHPAGYLIVGRERALVDSVDVLLLAIAAWQPGERIRLVVRRNPHTGYDTEWWESDVEWILPRTAR